MRELIRINAPMAINKAEKRAFEGFGFFIHGRTVLGFPEDFEDFSKKAPISLVAQEIGNKYRSADYQFATK